MMKLLLKMSDAVFVLPVLYVILLNPATTLYFDCTIAAPACTDSSGLQYLFMCQSVCIKGHTPPSSITVGP